MASIDSKKQKLLKFLLKEIPGLVPFAGNLWKAAIDEFTEGDVDKALKRIERFQQKDREAQKEILLSILLLKKDLGSIMYAFDHIRRQEERARALTWVTEMNWGNARFLIALQKSRRAFTLNYNFTKELRDRYLDLLEGLAKEEGCSPGVFHYVDGLVAFPDGYEKYATVIRNPILEKTSVPVLIEDLRVTMDPDGWHFEGGVRKPIPFLPTTNGFINGFDDETGLPNSVLAQPSVDFYGAYYWVRPNGLRTIAKGIGVLDPVEVLYGTAIWWSWDDRSPIIGMRIFVDGTPEVNKKIYAATIENYKDAIKSYLKKKPKGSIK